VVDGPWRWRPGRGQITRGRDDRGQRSENVGPTGRLCGRCTWDAGQPARESDVRRAVNMGFVVQRPRCRGAIPDRRRLAETRGWLRPGSYTTTGNSGLEPGGQVPSARRCGVAAYYLGHPSERHALDTAARSLLLWSAFPDNTSRDSEARFAEHFAQIEMLLETAWKSTVMSLPQGRRVLVTSDHGYVFLGGGTELLAAPRRPAAPDCVPRRPASCTSTGNYR
jgi:hypothetical protein